MYGVIVSLCLGHGTFELELVVHRNSTTKEDYQIEQFNTQLIVFKYVTFNLNVLVHLRTLKIDVKMIFSIIMLMQSHFKICNVRALFRVYKNNLI